MYATEKGAEAAASGALLGEGILSILKNPKAAWRTLTSVKSLFSSSKNIVKIEEIEDGVMIFSAQIGEENIQGVTNIVVKNKQLIWDQLHIQGSKAGNIGRENLWNVAKDLGKQFKVNEVLIQGGKRTTGKYIGTTPSPIKIN